MIGGKVSKRKKHQVHERLWIWHDTKRQKKKPGVLQGFTFYNQKLIALVALHS
jgi:hypothetical protein